MILNDDLTYRVIHMDGRELEADPWPSWMGYSVGRWDGDTLVVDSAGFNDKTWVSRYRRPDFGQLIATIVGAYDARSLGAAGLDQGVPRPLVPESQTLFDGLGLGYRFIVDDEGVATDLMVIHVSGDYRYSRRR